MAKAKTIKPAAKAPGKRSRSAAPAETVVKRAAPVAAVASPRPRGRPRKVAPAIGAAPASTKPAAKAITERTAKPIIEAIEATAAKAVEAAPVPDQAAPSASAAEPIVDIAMKGPDMASTTETLKKNGEASVDRVQALFGDVNGQAKTALEKGTKLYNEMTELAKGNVEALVASSRVAAKGAEALGQDAAEYGKASLERASATFRSFATVKSPTELFKLQSDFAKTAFDDMVAESSKMSESLLKLVGEIAQPLSSRVALTAERVKSAAF